ncbi:MAG: hypothetical protein ACK4UO_06070 [Pseudolabrys sp.]
MKRFTRADLAALVPTARARLLLGMRVKVSVGGAGKAITVTIRGAGATGKSRLAAHLIELLEQLGAKQVGHTVELPGRALAREGAQAGLVRTFQLRGQDVRIRELLTAEAR